VAFAEIGPNADVLLAGHADDVLDCLEERIESGFSQELGIWSHAHHASRSARRRNSSFALVSGMRFSAAGQTCVHATVSTTRARRRARCENRRGREIDRDPERIQLPDRLAAEIGQAAP
jgi:hypothetical protein